MSIMTKTVYILHILICLSLIFRNSLSLISNLLGYVTFAMIAASVIIISLCNLLSLKTFLKGSTILILITVFLKIHCIYILYYYDIDINVLFIGVTNVLIMPIYFYALFKFFNLKIYKHKFDDVFIFMGVILSIGCFINYFISDTIFGLISASSDSYLTNSNIAKRGISFITSPQSLSACLFIPYVICEHRARNERKFYYTVFAIFIVLAALLSGTRTFLIMLLIYTILINIKGIKFTKIIYFLVTFSILVFITYFLSDSEAISRYLTIFSGILDLKDSDRMYAWLIYIDDFKTWDSILLGNGLGLLSRGAELLYYSTDMSVSSESYIIQIYYELGLLGIILFTALIIKSFYVQYLNKDNYYISIAIVTIFVNLIVAPAFYGFTTSFFYYYFIMQSYGSNLKENE